MQPECVQHELSSMTFPTELTEGALEPKPAMFLNTKSPEVLSMCEVLERKDRRQEKPYESDADKTDEEITEGLMKLSELSLHDFLESEPDIYTDDDLKVRYR